MLDQVPSRNMSLCAMQTSDAGALDSKLDLCKRTRLTHGMPPAKRQRTSEEQQTGMCVRQSDKVPDLYTIFGALFGPYQHYDTNLVHVHAAQQEWTVPLLGSVECIYESSALCSCVTDEPRCHLAC